MVRCSPWRWPPPSGRVVQRAGTGETAGLPGCSARLVHLRGRDPVRRGRPAAGDPVDDGRGAVTGALIMAFDVTLKAPHGGIFVFFAIGNLLWFLVALAAGHRGDRRGRHRRPNSSSALSPRNTQTPPLAAA